MMQNKRGIIAGICASGLCAAACYYFYKKYVKDNDDLAAGNIAMPDKYSINLVWINRKKNTDQHSLFPDEKQTQCINTIVDWAEKNPKAKVFVWYAGHLIAQDAPQKTMELISSKIAMCKSECAPIELKDIRNLRRVRENSDVFSCKIPVYFCVDFSKVVIPMEMIEEDRESAIVCPDFDVKAMKKKELFGQRTLALLQKNGFVMAHATNPLGFENSFQIMTYNEKLLQAMELMIVKVNVLRAKTFLQEEKSRKNPDDFFFNNREAWKLHKLHFQENVFYSYPLMNLYFLQLQGLDELTINGEVYKEADGIEMFNDNGKFIMTHTSAEPHKTNSRIPTKKVSVPRTTSFYSEYTRKHRDGREQL